LHLRAPAGARIFPQNRLTVCEPVHSSEPRLAAGTSFQPRASSTERFLALRWLDLAGASCRSNPLGNLRIHHLDKIPRDDIPIRILSD
jgi:hypothetical protein